MQDLEETILRMCALSDLDSISPESSSPDEDERAPVAQQQTPLISRADYPFDRPRREPLSNLSVSILLAFCSSTKEMYLVRPAVREQIGARFSGSCENMGLSGLTSSSQPDTA